MGAEQSARTNNEGPKLSQIEVQDLLNAQRKIYEQKCQEYMEKAAAASAQTQQANVTLQANLTLQTNLTQHDGLTQHASLIQQNDLTQQANQVQQDNLIQQANQMPHTNLTKQPILIQEANFTQQFNQTQPAKLAEQLNFSQQAKAALPLQQMSQHMIMQHPLQSQHANMTQQVNLIQQANQIEQAKLTQQVKQPQQVNLTQQANLTQQTNQTQQVKPTQQANLSLNVNQTQATPVQQQMPQCTPMQHTLQQTIQKPQQANQSQQTKWIPQPNLAQQANLTHQVNLTKQANQTQQAKLTQQTNMTQQTNQTQKFMPTQHQMSHGMPMHHALQQTMQKPPNANMTQQANQIQQPKLTQQIKQPQQVNLTQQANLNQQTRQTQQVKLTQQANLSRANQTQQAKLNQQNNLAQQTNQIQQAKSTPQNNLAKQPNQTQKAVPAVQHMSQCVPTQRPLQQTMSVQQQLPPPIPLRLAQQTIPMLNNKGPTVMPTTQSPQIQVNPNIVYLTSRLEKRQGPNKQLSTFVHDELVNMLIEKHSTTPNSNNVGPKRSATMLHVFTKDMKPVESFVMANSKGQIQKNQQSAPPRPARARSASRSRNKNVNDALKCPVCKQMFSLQIFQCNSGHSICKKCHEYRRPCVTCGGHSTSRRNIDLEKFVGETKVPCPHSKEGCCLYIKVVDMEFHVKECPFKEFQCPVGCSWRGHLKQLSGHFDMSHPEQRKADVDTEIRLALSKNCQHTYLIVIGSFNFLFHVKIFNGTLYMTAQLIGTKIGASKWSYEIHVFNKNDNQRKFLFTDPCSSFIEPVADIFRHGKCSIMPIAYASTFVNNGSLSYKFFIKKKVGSKPKGDSKKSKDSK